MRTLTDASGFHLGCRMTWVSGMHAKSLSKLIQILIQDLMIEAKDKEQAVMHLFRIYNLHSTIYGTLPVFSTSCSWFSLLIIP